MPKAGKLSNPDPKSLRRLFEQMDTDKSGESCLKQLFTVNQYTVQCTFALLCRRIASMTLTVICL